MQKKKIVLYILIIFFLILLIILSSLSIKTLENNLSTCCKSFCDFDSSSPFSINKIVYFSSSNCYWCNCCRVFFKKIKRI